MSSFYEYRKFVSHFWVFGLDVLLQTTCMVIVGHLFTGSGDCRPLFNPSFFVWSFILPVIDINCIHWIVQVQRWNFAEISSCKSTTTSSNRCTANNRRRSSTLVTSRWTVLWRHRTCRPTITRDRCLVSDTDHRTVVKKQFRTSVHTENLGDYISRHDFVSVNLISFSTKQGWL